MASGGWGGAYSNPFAGQAAAAATEQLASAAADQRTSQAFGAWGAGVGTAPPPSAPAAPSNVFASVAPAVVNGGAGLVGREAELQRREAELARREAALAAAGASGAIKNWPSCCPFIYHDIREQIPPWNRSMIRFTYLIELLTIAGFFYNTAIILATLFAGTGPGLQWFFLAMLALVMGVPLSWWLFYKSLFNSAQTDGATYSYMRSFILIILHMAWCVWMVLGLPGLGSFSAGVFPMMKLFQQGDSKGIAFGIMYIINVVIWGIAGLGCWVVMGLAVAAYRRGDGPRKDREYQIGGVQMQQA